MEAALDLSGRQRLEEFEDPDQNGRDYNLDSSLSRWLVEIWMLNSQPPGESSEGRRGVVEKMQISSEYLHHREPTLAESRMVR